MSQLELTFGKQTYQMTLTEFTQTMLPNTPADQQWYGPFRFEDSYAMRDEQQAAYIRKEYKWAVIRAENAGESVPRFVYAEHPILAQLYALRTGGAQ